MSEHLIVVYEMCKSVAMTQKEDKAVLRHYIALIHVVGRGRREYIPEVFAGRTEKEAEVFAREFLMRVAA